MIKAAGEIHSKGTENALGSILMDDLTIELTNPRSRHIALAAHQTNIFRSIANTFWYMAGGNDAYNPYYRFFNRCADQFITEWKASQFQEVINGFSCLDDRYQVFKNIQIEAEDNTLNMVVYLDYLNPNNVDPFEYSFLLESLSDFHEYELGTLTLFAETGIMSGNSVCRLYPQTPSFNESYLPLGHPVVRQSFIPDFYGSLIAQYGSMLTSTTTELRDNKENHWNDFKKLLEMYGVLDNSVLYEYVSLLYAYVLNRAGVKHNHRVTDRLTGDLLAAVTFTPERNFELME